MTDMRSIYRLAACAAIGLALGACGSAPVQTDGDMKRQASGLGTTVSNMRTPKNPDDELHCQRVRRVGSHIATWECATAGERRSTAANAQDFMHDMKTGKGAHAVLDPKAKPSF